MGTGGTSSQSSPTVEAAASKLNNEENMKHNFQGQALDRLVPAG